MEREATPNRHPSPTKQSSQALPGAPSPSPQPPPFNSQEHVEQYPSQLDQYQDDQDQIDEDPTVRAPVNPPTTPPKEEPRQEAPKRQEAPRRTATRTPEQQQPQPQTPKRNGHVEKQNGVGPGMDMQSPGHIPPFDWEEFEARYEQALMQSNKEQEQLLKEFDQLVKVNCADALSNCVRFQLILTGNSTSTSGHRLLQLMITNVLLSGMCKSMTCNWIGTLMLT